jgi:hypothetical protein
VACRRDKVDEFKGLIGSLAALSNRNTGRRIRGLTIQVEKKGPLAADRRGATENDTATGGQSAGGAAQRSG